jgi:hypothetical protein
MSRKSEVDVYIEGVLVTVQTFLSISWKKRTVMKYIFVASRYKWNTDTVEEDNNFVEG